LAVAVLATASVGLAAAPASASKCDPDGVCPTCEGPAIVENLYWKLTGQQLECA
jgi:hypothetical protein